jgi:hypothetical protein
MKDYTEASQINHRNDSTGTFAFCAYHFQLPPAPFGSNQLTLNTCESYHCHIQVMRMVR